MKIFNDLCSYISRITTIKEEYLHLFFSTLIVLCIFLLIKELVKKTIHKNSNGRKEYVINQTFQVIINILEVLVLLIIWDDYIKSLMTLISVLSAAMTIALRDIILNFFCGLYIKVKRPFKIEDRIQIDDVKGDVMNISALDFEILEISNAEPNGQSTGVIVSIPNSVVFSKPVKNLTKGFKYIWNEMVVRISMDSDLVKNKQEIYKIVNSIETIKNIPKKMRSQIANVNSSGRIYFNQYDPVIYTKIVEDHIELSVRYLMHPKKARYVESVIWNKIYNEYKAGKIDLYLKGD